MSKKKTENNKLSEYMLIVPMVLAGIIYNSWPLGYWLDPSTARNGIASDLERANHPFAWVFIAGDVITGLIVLIFAGGIFKKRRMINSFWWKAMVIGLILFGFFTAAGAGVPNKCLSGSASLCITYDHKTAGLDGIETSIAAFGLLIAFVSSCSLAGVLKLDKRFFWLNLTVFVAWFTSGMIFIHEILVSGGIHYVQEVELILSGIGLAVIAVNAYLSLKEV
jgi:hypothetical protein